MGSIVLKSLSILLGLFFIFVGFIKLSSYISKDLHKDLRKEYVKYAKVFPFSEALDFKIPSKWYRRTVGTLEIVCGIAMAFVPNHKVKNGANLCLLLLTLMAVYSHYMVADKLERTAPALVFLFMLSGRLVVYYQLTRREAERPEATVNGFKQE
ncbi:novel acetylcholine receptor chaperone [Tribolium castaneum]|uniref:Novel acetylcholine receptor chaperone n=1 Tax=Tribolium castaneum TaxID=7070 RepID=A0A139WI43_TRICA|nr:PREDICTED: transmembrane protein 35 [Tribolium castaneum]KYB27569.1 Transmembrane protein 35-like Protein [Tribolium castaneum]|eukprot:XP_971147.1 PREDICTED: transmembrane protein 35 [Tribolium castaneum]